MKAILFVAVALLSFSMAVANAETVAGSVPNPDTQYNLTAGAAGWG